MVPDRNISKAIYFMALLTLIQIVSNVYHINNVNSLTDSLRVVNYFFAFCGLLFLFRSERNVYYFIKHTKIVFYFFIVSVFIYMIFPYFSYYIAGDINFIKSIKTFAAKDFQYHSNPTSGVGAFLLLVIALTTQRGGIKAITFIMLGMLLIYLTGSFTSFLSVSLSILVLSILRNSITFYNYKKISKVLIGLFGLTFAASFIYFYHHDFSWYNEALTGRPFLWARPFLTFDIETIFFGNGAWTSLEGLEEYYSYFFVAENLSAVQVYEESMESLGSGGLHNVFLTLFYEKGIAVAIFQLFFFYYLLKKSFKASLNYDKVKAFSTQQFYKFNYVVLLFFFIRSFFEIGGIYGYYNAILDYIFIIYTAILLNLKLK